MICAVANVECDECQYVEEDIDLDLRQLATADGMDYTMRYLVKELEKQGWDISKHGDATCPECIKEAVEAEEEAEEEADKEENEED